MNRKTINYTQLVQSGIITQQQFTMLNWLAFCVFMHHHRAQEDGGKYYNMYLAYYNACEIIGIDTDIILNVSLGNIKGFQNFNRIATFETFEKNIRAFEGQE